MPFVFSVLDTLRTFDQGLGGVTQETVAAIDIQDDNPPVPDKVTLSLLLLQ